MADFATLSNPLLQSRHRITDVDLRAIAGQLLAACEADQPPCSSSRVLAAQTSSSCGSPRVTHIHAVTADRKAAAEMGRPVSAQRRSSKAAGVASPVLSQFSPAGEGSAKADRSPNDAIFDTVSWSSEDSDDGFQRVSTVPHVAHDATPHENKTVVSVPKPVLPREWLPSPDTNGQSAMKTWSPSAGKPEWPLATSLRGDTEDQRRSLCSMLSPFFITEGCDVAMTASRTTSLDTKEMLENTLPSFVGSIQSIHTGFPERSCRDTVESREEPKAANVPQAPHSYASVTLRTPLTLFLGQLWHHDGVVLFGGGLFYVSSTRSFHVTVPAHEIASHLSGEEEQGTDPTQSVEPQECWDGSGSVSEAASVSSHSVDYPILSKMFVDEPISDDQGFASPVVSSPVVPSLLQRLRRLADREGSTQVRLTLKLTEYMCLPHFSTSTHVPLEWKVEQFECEAVEVHVPRELTRAPRGTYAHSAHGGGAGHAGAKVSLEPTSELGSRCLGLVSVNGSEPLDGTRTLPYKHKLRSSATVSSFFSDSSTLSRTTHESSAPNSRCPSTRANKPPYPNGTEDVELTSLRDLLCACGGAAPEESDVGAALEKACRGRVVVRAMSIESQLPSARLVSDELQSNQNAYPVPVPHRRPVGITAVSSSPENVKFKYDLGSSVDHDFVMTGALSKTACRPLAVFAPPFALATDPGTASPRAIRLPIDGEVRLKQYAPYLLPFCLAHDVMAELHPATNLIHSALRLHFAPTTLLSHMQRRFRSLVVARIESFFLIFLRRKRRALERMIVIWTRLERKAKARLEAASRLLPRPVPSQESVPLAHGPVEVQVRAQRSADQFVDDLVCRLLQKHVVTSRESKVALIEKLHAEGRRELVRLREHYLPRKPRALVPFRTSLREAETAGQQSHSPLSRCNPGGGDRGSAPITFDYLLTAVGYKWRWFMDPLQLQVESHRLLLDSLRDSVLQLEEVQLELQRARLHPRADVA